MSGNEQNINNPFNSPMAQNDIRDVNYIFYPCSNKKKSGQCLWDVLLHSHDLIALYCGFNHYKLIASGVSKLASDFLLWTMEGYPPLGDDDFWAYNEEFVKIKIDSSKPKIRLVVFSEEKDLSEYEAIDETRRNAFYENINKHGTLYFTSRFLLVEYLSGYNINIDDIKLDVGYLNFNISGTAKKELLFQGNWTTKEYKENKSKRVGITVPADSWFNKSRFSKIRGNEKKYLNHIDALTKFSKQIQNALCNPENEGKIFFRDYSKVLFA